MKPRILTFPIDWKIYSRIRKVEKSLTEVQTLTYTKVNKNMYVPNNHVERNFFFLVKTSCMKDFARNKIVFKKEIGCTSEEKKSKWK